MIAYVMLVLLFEVGRCGRGCVAFHHAIAYHCSRLFANLLILHLCRF